MVLTVTVAKGTREVLFRHDATHALLSLRTMILRRERDQQFRTVAVVGPDSSKLTVESSENRAERSLRGGRLRFILRTALPQIHQRDLTATEQLFMLPEGQRLVILAGAKEHLSSADQLKLGLEAIHPGRSGTLEAYATAVDHLSRR